MIGGKVGRASAVQLDRSGSKIPTPAKATPSTPVPVAATKPEPAAAPEPPAKQSAGAPQVSSSFREVVENAKKNLASVSAKSSQQPAKAEGRKLDLAELDVAATALQLLVRHRGGGPFGSGRLEGKEAEELGTSLKAALAMLQKDASSSESTTAPAPSKSSVEMASSPATTSRSIAPSPVAAGNTKPTPSTTPQVPPLKAAVAAPTPMPAPVAEKPKAAKSMVSASEGAAAAPGGMKVVTIAEGLDSFLLAPKEVSTEDLKGLRDGIIHCLGLIQAEILSRPLEQPVQPSSATAASVGSSPTASKTAPLLSEGESLDKQLKVAMGLLLKHRGGPSFGHGRLQGEELSNLEQRLQTLAGTFLEESEGSEGGKTVLKIFDN